MCETDIAFHEQASASAPTQRRLVLAIVVNLVYVGAEFLLGIRYDSMGLLADAGHNLSDILGLVVSLLAYIMQSKKASDTFSYGFKSATLLATLVNSLFLMVAIGLIVFECVDKLLHGSAAYGIAIMVTAGLGILVNGSTTWLLSAGRNADLNAKGAYLHMLADTLVSVGVVVAGGIIMLTRWMWFDPVIGIAIAGIILWSSLDFFKETFILALDGVPSGIHLGHLREGILRVANVAEVHHIHVWALSTTETALTAHVRLLDAALLENTRQILKDLLKKHSIGHSTLEFELDDCCPEQQC